MTGFKQFLYKWIEQYLFFPNVLQQFVSIAFLPLTVIYCIITAYKRATAKPINFGIPIISVGNLIVGGSGKTPVTISLAKDKENAAVILRGYGRKSKGLHIVSINGDILVDIFTSGDEAMLLAKSLPNATIIVSEDRKEAIIKAKELGCKVVFLDDGFSKYNIKKFDILIRPEIEPTNIFCLPSGGYRETKMMYSFADIVLKEETDFKRNITFKRNREVIDNLPNELVLLTAISKPKRLLKFLPNNTKLESYSDHYYFTIDDINNIERKYENYSIITTQKDFVKLESFNLSNIIIMELDVTIQSIHLDKINNFLKSS